jgi:hypothetical protein
MTCTKCDERPRAKGSTWCKRCLADAAKVRRATRHATPDATHATADATSHATRGHVACRMTIEALETEVRQLKRELAERGAVVAPSDAREAVLALFEAFVRDPAVRQALGRVPWGGFRDRVLGAL